jgi:hypothetical protein
MRSLMQTSKETDFPLQAGRLASLILATFATLLLPDPALAASVQFNTDIRPLLSDRCFSCHGPDASHRKAKLRLDTATGIAESSNPDSRSQVIVPGKADESELYRRLITEDADDLMPPPESNLKLNATEKALLAQWINEGAVYEGHWSFEPVRTPPIPATAPVSAHPIDAFVLARLKQEGLESSPPANREQLIRRISLDLTGLPPTLEQIDAFVADASPNALDKVIDQFLASPAYGEWRANEWLDLARYADTYGFQADVERDLYPWRDWVIQSFNENLPYDDFVTWQIAGDLLENPTREQILATAFNRLHRQTNEGGSIEQEWRTEYVADRVITTSTAFLGLTMECARCHDHKFDPITQRDFYSMFAFFDDIDESGLYSHFTRAVPTPTLLLYPDGIESQHQALRSEISLLEAQYATAEETARNNLDPASIQWPVLPQPSAAYPLDHFENNTTPDIASTNRTATLVEGPASVPGHSGQALRFSGDNSVVCRDAGDFNRTTPFSFNLWIQPAEHQPRAVVFHRSQAWTDSGSRGYELVLEDMKPTFALIHFWPGNAIAIRATESLPTNAWTQLTVTYDGSSHANGLRLYRNGQPVKTEVVRDHLYKDILHRAEWGDSGAGNIHLTLAGRFRDSGFRNGAIDEFQVFNRQLTDAEVLLLNQPAATAIGNHALVEHHLARHDETLETLRAKLHELRRQENTLVQDIPEIMVMRDMATPRSAHILKRGAYDSPGEPVEPDMPAALLPYDASLPRNRLGLAHWMTDPRNPLTARVAVNRVWKSCFGRGLVSTTEDFGSQGEAPTHPLLLDWLTRQFVESGWNLKQLYKLILTSATYQQASHASPELVERDPDNLFLARGPKYRLQAEQIRDAALAVSGLLNPALGGPSVKPYQPAGVWEESGTGKSYQQDHGEKLYRRSLYTFWRRTAPPPSMLTFDATSREVCTARRETTATPLQALVMMNDTQFLEAARVMAQNLLKEHPDNPEARVRTAFRLLTGRQPQPAEMDVLLLLSKEQLDLFGNQEEQASRFLSRTGESPVNDSLPPTQLAATTLVVSTIMNLDEFTTLR